MTPVRRLERSNVLELLVFQLGDEHGGHAVKHRAALSGDRFERRAGVKALGRQHHRGAMGDGAERAQHHAETVIHRHRNADPVGLGQAHVLGDQMGVVDDIMMGQRRRFRGTGRARRELNIDGIVEL